MFIPCSSVGEAPRVTDWSIKTVFLWLGNRFKRAGKRKKKKQELMTSATSASVCCKLAELAFQNVNLDWIMNIQRKHDLRASTTVSFN